MQYLARGRSISIQFPCSSMYLNSIEQHKKEKLYGMYSIVPFNTLKVQLSPILCGYSSSYFLYMCLITPPTPLLQQQTDSGRPSENECWYALLSTKRDPACHGACALHLVNKTSSLIVRTRHERSSLSPTARGYASIRNWRTPLWCGDPGFSGRIWLWKLCMSVSPCILNHRYTTLYFKWYNIKSDFKLLYHSHKRLLIHYYPPGVAECGGWFVLVSHEADGQHSG